MRRRMVGVGVLAAVVSGGCGLFDSGEVSTRSASDLSTGMRPVPTVPTGGTQIDAPSSDATAAGGTTAGGTVDAGAGPPPSGGEVLGDPPRRPDPRDTLPPLPDSPPIEGCTRLADLTDAIGAAVGASVTPEAIAPDVCRMATGSVVVEVHDVSEATVETDWFRRPGIEPVGNVSGDAVGIAAFVAPGSDRTSGYTIALVGRRQGAVIAVTGATDDRASAEAIASLVIASL